MKKALIISAFILGGAVIMTGLTVIYIWLVLVLNDFVALILSLLLDIFSAVAFSLVLKRAGQTSGIGGARLSWCFHAPAAILGIFLFIKGALTPSGDLFSGRAFAGLGDVLFGISLLATVFVMMITTAFVFAMNDNETADSSEQESPQITLEQVEDNEKTEV